MVFVAVYKLHLAPVLLIHLQQYYASLLMQIPCSQHCDVQNGKVRDLQSAQEHSEPLHFFHGLYCLGQLL